MSTVKRDLWPEDIKADDVIAPSEILAFQADQLAERTNGLLSASIEAVESEDRIAIRFEIEVTRCGDRVRLFEVQHRLDYEYPVAIIPPNEERLPDFLQERTYKPTPGEALRSITRSHANAMAAVGSILGSTGTWVENKWIATSPTEFSEKVEKVLSLPAVKAVVLSLLARANRPDSENLS
jgi:hypothetical protein